MDEVGELLGERRGDGRGNSCASSSSWIGEALGFRWTSSAAGYVDPAVKSRSSGCRRLDEGVVDKRNGDALRVLLASSSVGSCNLRRLSTSSTVIMNLDPEVGYRVISAGSM